MKSHHKLKLLFALISLFVLLFFLFLLFYYFRLKMGRIRVRQRSIEEGSVTESEDLITFSGGEELTSQEILDAPGEVVGKSSYGTLYRAGFGSSGSAMMLRFLRPACVGRREEVVEAVRVVGDARHRNLVPLRGVYVGPRGEKLFVYPYFEGENLAQFLKDGKAESHRWEIIYNLSLGIARGLNHLHNGLQKPIAHGNLKSKNILLDSDHQPLLLDFGLHLLLNPTAAQEMLEASAAQGYKAPELIKMKDANKETDIYSLGVIFLEILTRKESMSLLLPASLKNMFLEHKIFEEFSSNLSDESKNKNNTIEESLCKFFHLARACCSPSPVLRPDIKQVIKNLEEL